MFFQLLRNKIFRTSDTQLKKYIGKILVIGGGEVFDTYDSYLTWLRALELRKQTPSWKSWLTSELDQHNLEVIRVGMPNTFYAKYDEWNIMFSKYIAQIDTNTSLVGHSLGAMFLLKFLHENARVCNKVQSVHLIAPSFSEAYTFAVTSKDLPNSEKFYFYQSKDDDVVPWSESTTKKILENNLTNNHVRLFEDRGHFLGRDFKELRNNLVDLLC